MPYKHAGEIGDIWKHLPLCDILIQEAPLRYFESNSAYSHYIMDEHPKTEYGILNLLNLHDKMIDTSAYIRILHKYGIIENMVYLGSPGQAMAILNGKTFFYFHDIEQEALDNIHKFSIDNHIENVNTVLGDSIKAFLNNSYSFTSDDFVFLDPYFLFHQNETGATFFDIFEKSMISGAKTLLWYGYDNLRDQKLILSEIRRLSEKNKIHSHCFDVWQASMTDIGCDINPGVPGCGLAGVNLSVKSVELLYRYLDIIKSLYLYTKYDRNNAKLLTQAINY